MKTYYYFHILMFALLTLSCQQSRYQYQDQSFLDIDNPDIQQWTEEEFRIFGEAQQRVGLIVRERGTTEYEEKGRHGLKASNGASVNISERLYYMIWSMFVYYHEDLDYRSPTGIIDVNALRAAPKEDLIYAIMHSGSNSSAWSRREYNKICRYADRINKNWREDGFSLEEMDQMVWHFRNLHRKELNLTQADSVFAFDRKVVLVWSEHHDRVVAVNALRPIFYSGRETNVGEYRLKVYDFDRGARYGYPLSYDYKDVKYIYE